MSTLSMVEQIRQAAKARSGHYDRGRQRTYDIVMVVQALADGKTVEEMSGVCNVKPSALSQGLKKLRHSLKLKTTYQLVAHYIRNGWID